MSAVTFPNLNEMLGWLKDADWIVNSLLPDVAVGLQGLNHPVVWDAWGWGMLT